MADTFSTAIDRVLMSEGGLVDNPQDPGGLTNYGIAQRSYPNVDIHGLTRDGAIAIYRRDFWDQIQGDNLPPIVAFQVLDAAVNHGIGNAIRWLQTAAGVAPDGHFGPVSLAAVKTKNPSDLLLLFLAERLDFYTRLTTFNTFGRGWTRRIVANLRYGSQDN